MAFTLGIEEEFQMVDSDTGQLAPHIHTILEKGIPLFGEKIKAEMHQSFVEIITDICPDIAAARVELQTLRRTLVDLLASEGIAPISAGTHPDARWQDAPITQKDRYIEMEEEFQDVGRAALIFGLHIHVGVDERQILVPLMNQVRTWLPHLVALSSNSAFCAGRNSGMKSYRSVIWRQFPRSGIPDLFPSTTDFDSYVQSLTRTGCIDNGKRIWWDVRPHPFFDTIEFRVCDMPATLDDELALAALCQALVAKLTWLHKHNITTYALPRHFIEENKWRAMRYGLDTEVIDFVQHRRLSMRDSISELLDFVDDVVDNLNSRREINFIRALLEDPRGTGADRQIAVYHETGSVHAVTHFLMEQTMEGITRNSAHT